jgi:hypothetical protein
MQITRKDPCRASGRMGPEVGSSSCILGVLEGFRESASLVAAGQVAGVGLAVVAAGSCGDEGGMFRGKVLDRIRMDLGHRPYRLAHRTPVLYSRSQLRTKIAPCKEKVKEGGGSACRVAHNDFAE